VIGYLEDFLFAPARSRSPVKSLSGGERARLLLARLFARPANVLVLDEPTNDLDIETLELLEALLQDYAGTVFLVSHDREFLDNVVTQSIVSEGDGIWKEYVGGYSDWLRQRPALAGIVAAPSSPVKVGAGINVALGQAAVAQEKANQASVPVATKLSFKEKRELEQLPDRIAAMEAEQTGLQSKLADPAFYTGQPDAIKVTQQRLAELERDIENAMERWGELESRA
jgi:ATP-binding cassette subfamily F protein uup